MTQKSKADSDPMQEKAVRDTFPASDPTGNPAEKGARAVPVESMKAHPAPEPDGAATLSATFADAEAAKLALEALVREGPVPREHAGIETGPKGATLRIQVRPADRDRLRAMLEREAARA